MNPAQAIRRFALLLVWCLLAAVPVAAQQGRFNPGLIESFARLPIQDGGRIKPVSSFADFSLLSMNGRRTVSLPDGQTISATEWLLCVLFLPDLAREIPSFLVQNSDVLDVVGISHEGKRKRDRYTWAELEAQANRILDRAREFSRKDSKLRTPVEQQVVLLGNNVFRYMQFSAAFEFARARFAVPDGRARQILGKEEAVFSEVLKAIPPLLAAHQELRAAGAEQDGELRELHSLLLHFQRTAARADALAIFPPPRDAAAERTWRTIADLAAEAFAPSFTGEELPAAVVDCERLAAAVADRERFEREMSRLVEDVRQAASARGEGYHVDLEVSYYRMDLVFRSLLAFLFGFLVCAFLWLMPRVWLLTWAAVILTVLGNMLLTYAIVLRCIIRERPPVSTLYETILFITCVLVYVALAVEWIHKNRIALSLATFLGALGMFLAMRHEVVEGVDTMPSLVAVLDTNFWLATHVTTVTIGYAAGLLAAAIAHVYVLGRLFRWRRTDVAFYKTLGRSVYGVLCFALIFSLVGTVLGGIWANDSWGRFWGWDPKENGALMIVLSQLAILHARMGGYLRDFGVCMASIGGAIIIGFSWWGVNLLGVGLHSYGFTHGVGLALNSFYAFEGLILVLGAIGWWRDRSIRRRFTAPVAS